MAAITTRIDVAEDSFQAPKSKPTISSIKLTNLLSFGPDNEPLPLLPLNILIGANAVGKSNLIDAFALLKAAANNSLTEFISRRGGVGQWIWKGAAGATASIEAVIPYSDGSVETGDESLRYCISFSESKEHELEKFSYWLDGAAPLPGTTKPLRYTSNESSIRPSSRGSLGINLERLLTEINRGKGAAEFVSSLLRSITAYRGWSFSRDPLCLARTAQPVGGESSFLLDDASNLPAALKYISDRGMKAELKRYLKKVNGYAKGFDVNEVGNPPILQLTLQERNFIIDASRFSDGTMRWLALLTVLLHPTPPPLVCLEDPEVGLHPDMIPILADLLREAATRTQLVVVTESLPLISSFSRTPEVVLVCEKEEGATHISRLDPDLLNPSLEKYKLGTLWSMGQIGGNRF